MDRNEEAQAGGLMTVERVKVVCLYGRWNVAERLLCIWFPPLPISPPAALGGEGEGITCA